MQHAKSVSSRTAIAYRYLNKGSTVYLAVRPQASTRDFQFYTRYIPEISRDTNLIYGWVDVRPSAIEIDDRCNIITCHIDTARIVADSMQMPLVINMREYCDIYSHNLVEEVYFYRGRQ